MIKFIIILCGTSLLFLAGCSWVPYVEPKKDTATLYFYFKDTQNEAILESQLAIYDVASGCQGRRMVGEIRQGQTIKTKVDANNELAFTVYGGIHGYFRCTMTYSFKPKLSEATN